MNTRQRHAVLFQALGHPVRLQILEILSQGPSCVCDLVALTGKRQPYISQHLATLRSAGLVITERQGLNIFYQLNFSKLAELQAAVATLSQPKRDRTEDETITPSDNNICHDIPRAEVPWRPTINLELCSGCLSCMDTCPDDVYDWDGALGHPIVARPENCAIYCRGCAMACPEDAITFPNQDEVVELVKQLRVKYAA
jgi:DNA-binding transcriptional ArsR family regulator/NAD-dependent dihydropyrimidine dehydrogenase PreA subunit